MNGLAKVMSDQPHPNKREEQVQHSCVKTWGKSWTSNIKKTRIKVGKRKEYVGKNWHIRGSLKFVAFLNSRRLDICGFV